MGKRNFVLLILLFVILSISVSAEELKVHFKLPAGWTNAYIYLWETSPSSTQQSWPGTPMVKDENGWYSYTINGVKSSKLIFNNNQKPQTSNLARNKEGWYKDGEWYDTNPDTDSGAQISAEIEIPYEPVENFKWFWDAKSKSYVILSYIGNSQDVNIPREYDGAKVTWINERAFFNKGLNSVTIPDTIKLIGNSAFKTNNLRKIVIPNSVTGIGKEAFAYNKITEITIPKSITFMDINVFMENKITKVIWETSLKNIPANTFAMNQINSLSIPNWVEKIEYGAFQSNSIVTLEIGKAVKQIDENAFWQNKIETLMIPDNVISIGKWAFGYNNIKELKIGKNVTDIGQQAFDKSTFTNITIPSSVKNIGAYAFNNGILTRISGKPGSAAETYANQAGVRFEEK